MLNLTREECQSLVSLLNKMPGYTFLYYGKALDSAWGKLNRHLEVLNAEKILDTLTEEAQVNGEYD